MHCYVEAVRLAGGCCVHGMMMGEMVGGFEEEFVALGCWSWMSFTWMGVVLVGSITVSVASEEWKDERV